MHALQLRRYAAAAWRHRWKSLAVAWLIAILGWVGAYTLPNQFVSSARIYAEPDAILGTLLRGIAIDSSQASQVDMLQRTLLSRPNLERVIARTDLDMRVHSLGDREALLNRLATAIRITPQTRNLFTVEYRDVEPNIARDVVQTTLNLFVESATGNDRQQMENARTFLSQQIASYEVKLREAERRRAEFQARYIDVLPSESGGASRLETARARLNQLTGELEDARMRRELTRQQLDQAPQLITIGTEPGTGGGDTRLADAERNLRELRLRFTDEHPDVTAARNAVSAARGGSAGNGGGRTTAARPVSRPNPLHEQLRVRMVDADAQVAALERQARDGTAEVERLSAVARGEPEVQAQFTNLDRDYTVLRRNYEELLGRRESLQLANAARTGSDRVKLEIIDPPTLPQAPIGPNRPLLAAAALAVGIAAGVLLAFVMIQFDVTFYTIRDLRKIGLPILGSVSGTRPGRNSRTGSIAAFSAACALLFVAFGVALTGPEIAREAIGLVRQAVA